MTKKILSLVLCIMLLFCFVACEVKNIENTPSPANLNTNKPTGTPDNTKKTPTPEKEEQSMDVVFNTKNVANITFYAYYGHGKGSQVPQENMTEIITWLDSFTFGEKAPDLPPPGTNTCYVEIEYTDGTVIKKGLDVASVNGVAYCLERDKEPECFREIISKTSLE